MMIREVPILEEIHAVREEIARVSEYDIDRMMEAARARQLAEGRRVVRFSARAPEAAAPKPRWLDNTGSPCDDRSGAPTE